MFHISQKNPQIRAAQADAHTSVTSHCEASFNRGFTYTLQRCQATHRSHGTTHTSG
jgi:hypothetical protein